MRFTLLLAAAAAFAQESAKTLENPFTSDIDIASGEKLFRSQCASCHGYDARGGASGPDISTGNYRRASSDEGLFQLINKGIPGTSMPAFPLNARPAWQVVHLRVPSRLACGFARGPGERVGKKRRHGETREPTAKVWLVTGVSLLSRAPSRTVRTRYGTES